MRSLGIRYPTLLPEECTPEDGIFLRLADAMRFEAQPPQQSRVHRVEVVTNEATRKGRWWLQPAPGLPEELQVVEGPMAVKDGRCTVDVIAHGTVHCGPGTRLVEARPFTQQDDKWLRGLARAEHNRNSKIATLEQCKRDANIQHHNEYAQLEDPRSLCSARLQSGALPPGGKSSSSAPARFLRTSYPGMPVASPVLGKNLNGGLGDGSDQVDPQKHTYTPDASYDLHAHQALSL